ncbi:PorP/SprF family type IX secretion system membrane protein [Bizionia myxarmorum]|uniref:Type IX secretion system membrane protein PorP/SprF n=1 Tax=Bizionia myxarmorum TaxID=291186 RepID=A0A5D0R008_9FLAO|nr:type IX secretion system membrane protein PorP/SprF [Bizionia myxarmorum]TYB74315.1 type IX secretion system membrane protein PorP/SprF [Bizionia myxarmorum]
MKNLYLLTALLLCSIFGYSQELTIPTYTQYLADNPFIISPAYAGIGDYVKIRANGLTQWVGIKDAPDMQSLAADMRLGERSGVGLFLYNDKNGFTEQRGFRASFAHHLTLDKGRDQFVSFGMSYNMNIFQLDISKYNVSDISIENDRKMINHNFDVAALYRLESFYASFTASNILDKDLDKFGINEPGKLRNYQLYTGYVFNRSRNSDYEIEPSLYIQYFEGDGRSTTDLNLKYRRLLKNDNYFWAGLSYRFLNDQIMEPLNIGPMAGVKVSNFYFAYSYQIITNELINNNSGTHMVTIGLDIFQGVSNCRCTL